MVDYPLEQIGTIKQKKLDEAERLLRDKKKALEKEEEKLKIVEKERDEVKNHRHAKLTQLRASMDEGAPPTKIQQMRAYLKVVDEKLKLKEQKVKEQQKAVEAALKQVEIARADMLKKQQDVEKIKMHREEWDKEIRAIEVQKEGTETDEIGSVLHHRKKTSSPKKREH
ncbi:MAG: flagellar FliJ family protein [Verrucomicrobia bacterium]|nr:flagellar FliJ family protein [Verrucomicrobiota bacterium]